jgi:hypothetical protein
MHSHDPRLRGGVVEFLVPGDCIRATVASDDRQFLQVKTESPQFPDGSCDSGARFVAGFHCIVPGHHGCCSAFRFGFIAGSTLRQWLALRYGV